MTASAPSSTSSTTRVSLNVVLTVVMAIFSMFVASTIRSQCGPPCQAGECPAYCQPIWNLMPHPETSSVIKDSPSLTTEDGDAAPAKKKGTKLLSKLFKRGKGSAPGKNKYPHSSAEPPGKLSKADAAITTHMDEAVHASISNLDARAAAVTWGGAGGPTWYNQLCLRAYLKIMKWPSPANNWNVKFPFKLCGKDGCPPERAVAHSLEWREQYKPWCMSPSGIKENRKGWVYHRGHSPNNGYSLVWLRIPIHRTEDPIQWVRAIMNALERAVADSYKRTNGKIGRFNCVMDGQGFSLSHLFGMGHIKRMVTMLQDHFPDKLGVIIFANFAKPAQIMVGLVKPIITKDVREKLYMLPDEPHKRKAMTDALIGDEFVPHYLGGADDYRFDPAKYYGAKKHQCTEAESTQYIKTMPYHNA